MGPASLALARLQVNKASAPPLLVLWLLPLHAFFVAFDFVLFPLHAFFVAFNFVLFLCVFLAAVALHGFNLLYFCKIGIRLYPLT